MPRCCSVCRPPHRRWVPEAALLGLPLVWLEVQAHLRGLEEGGPWGRGALEYTCTPRWLTRDSSEWVIHPSPLGGDAHALQGVLTISPPQVTLRFTVEAPKVRVVARACPLGLPEICVPPLKQWVRKHGSPCCEVWRVGKRRSYQGARGHPSSLCWEMQHVWVLLTG